MSTKFHRVGRSETRKPEAHFRRERGKIQFSSRSIDRTNENIDGIISIIIFENDLSKSCRYFSFFLFVFILEEIKSLFRTKFDILMVVVEPQSRLGWKLGNDVKMLMNFVETVG